MNVNQLRVSSRLGIGFGLMSVLLVIVSVLGLNRMAFIKSQADDITKINNVEARLAAAMDLTVTERALALRNLILLDSANKKEVQMENDRVGEQAKKYADAARELDAMFSSIPSTSAKEKALLKQIGEQAALAAPFYPRAVQLALDGKKDEAYQLVRFEFRPVQKKWWALMRELASLEQQLNDEALSDADTAYRSARTLMITFAVLALATGALAAWVITRGLLRQLGGEPTEAVRIAGRIAAGDLAVEIETHPRDDASLMFAMRSMRDSLARIVGQVRTGTDTIATASAQIAAGNFDLSARTEQQASSLEETASSMEEMTSAVKQNADNARQANALAMSASHVAEKGGNVVSQVVHTMGAINQSAQKIVEIIGVIDGIAFQTNILALNAAVEAARAGEQGRGFAVVATEVRNLAQRSAAAAKEIKALISDSVDKVDSGNKLVEEAGATMHEVVDSIKRVTDIMSEIVAASEEQASGIDQVNQAITQMDTVTQQNASLVEEAAAAAQSMTEQAGHLAQVVSVFLLAATERGAVHGGTARAEPQLAPVVRLASSHGGGPQPARRGERRQAG
jgi:methyl-accepting chemotaxis protein